MSEPPPSYGEAAVAVAKPSAPPMTVHLPHLPPRPPLKKIPPPLPIPSNYPRFEAPPLPTPLPYLTPCGTPFQTAPNTPMGYPTLPNTHPHHNFPPMMTQQQQLMMAQQIMAQYGGIPMQQFTFPQNQQAGAAAAPSNAPINVVVNANANSAADGGDALTQGAGGDGKPTICPNCRKGVLVREQDRHRAKKIKLLALVTSCILCCLPCCCLRRNFVNQCPSCKRTYGKHGSKKQKKTQYA